MPAVAVPPVPSSAGLKLPPRRMKNIDLLTVLATVSLSVTVNALYITLPRERENGDRFPSTYQSNNDYMPDEHDYHHDYHKSTEQSSHHPQNILSEDDTPTTLRAYSTEPTHLNPVPTSMPPISIPGLDLSTTIIHEAGFKLDMADMSLWLPTPSFSTSESFKTSMVPTPLPNISFNTVISQPLSSTTTSTETARELSLASETRLNSAQFTSTSGNPTAADSAAMKSGNASLESFAPTILLGKAISVAVGIMIGIVFAL
ncbi:hypothetical protein D9757_005372 [Collybiopsis confluens]|uniref:Uncharacterized protein n=1 Tax=Collybiopsis confluens TaxID=2823264 RepID=A0A8H5M8Q8_9AGAR|nr:hypothetical protein D9757_005372 [Collybiopsis confluens]